MRRKIIVRSIAGLARDLGIMLVAEGVETEAELWTLQDLGVRYAQGFLLARPEIGALPEINARLSLRRDAA